MEAIKQPDEVAIPSDDGASPSRTFDFVVSVLKHEDSFLLWKKGDSDRFFDVPMRPASAERSAPSCTGLIPLVVPAGAESPSS